MKSDSTHISNLVASVVYISKLLCVNVNCMKASLIKPTDDQLNLADIDTIKVIGKGAGGTVQLVQHKWTGQFFALKVSTFTWTSFSHDIA